MPGSDAPNLKPFVLAQLTELCRAHPAAAKWVFVPSRQVGYNLGVALARSGCAWVNLELVTPIELAERRSGASLLGSRRRRLSEDARLLLIDELLAEAISEEPGSPFAAIPRPDALSGALSRTFTSLRLAGVTPVQLLARLESEKGRFVGGLYRAYVRRLHYDGWIDDGDLLDRAIADLTERPSRSKDVFAILNETPVPGLLGRFVSRAAASPLLRLGGWRQDALPPSHSAAVRLASLTQTFVVPNLDVRSRPPELRKTVGSESEVREALREVIVGGVPLDDVEIAYTSENPYLYLTIDLADRFDLACTFASGIPITLTRPGQAVMGFLRWIGGGFAAADLVSLAQGCFLDPILPREGEYALRGHELARVLRTARVRRGREQYEAQLGRLAAEMSPSSTQRPRDVDVRAVRLAREAVRQLLDLAPGEAECGYADMAAAASGFLDRFARVSTERDAIAIESLQKRLLQVASAPVGIVRAERAATRLLEIIRPHKAGASAAAPGAIHVAPIGHAGYTGRRYLFVVGMDERSFPGVATEDPLLLDDERAAISPDLNLLHSAHTEQIWHLERLLESASNSVVFAAGYGIADAREVHPSAYFQDLAAVAHRVTEMPLIPSAEAALDAPELITALRGSPELQKVLADRFPALASGYCAVQTRREGGFTTYHGWVGQPLPPDLVPGEVRPVSVSRLEDLARCPYRYFLQVVLGVRPPDTSDDEPSRWLSPAESGALLHEVFRRFMEEMARRGERPDPALHEELALSLFDEIVDAYLVRIPYENEATFRADRGRMRRAVRIFLRAESDREATPVGFEVSFGENISGGLNRPEPVSVRLSERTRLLLRGRIDRVDSDGVGFQLWDYKTGSVARVDESDLLEGGRRLQWALYAHAFEEMLNDSTGMQSARVSASGYFFPGDRGYGMRISAAPPPREELNAALGPLLEMIRGGALLHVQRSKECHNCHFAAVCSDEFVSCKSIQDTYRKDPESIRPDLPFRDALLAWVGAPES